MGTIRDIAKFTLTPTLEKRLTSEMERNLRKAPDKVFHKTTVTPPSSYVGATSIPSIEDEQHEITHTTSDGVTSFQQPSIPISGVVVDGDEDLQYANGVRVAYQEQHNPGGSFRQTGRIKNVGGVLMLFPERQPTPTLTREPKTIAEAEKQLLRLQREIEVMKRRLAYQKETS